MHIKLTLDSFHQNLYSLIEHKLRISVNGKNISSLILIQASAKKIICNIFFTLFAEILL